MTGSSRGLALLLLLSSGATFAAVGKVAVLEGSASRTPKGGVAQPLKPDSPIEVEDTLEVTKGNLKLVLNDQSVIMLAEGSQLRLDEASFSGQERQGFSAKLLFGKIWSKVTKAVGGSKFEVTTERAVAGVRGTIFRIDTDTLVKGATRTRAKAKKPVTVVSVTEGLVDVTARVKKAAPPAPPAQKPQGERKQVPPPFHQVTKDEWEEKFVQLKANMRVVVGDELWQEAAIDPSEQRDAFASFVEGHD